MDTKEPEIKTTYKPLIKMTQIEFVQFMLDLLNAGVIKCVEEEDEDGFGFTYLDLPFENEWVGIVSDGLPAAEQEHRDQRCFVPSGEILLVLKHADSGIFNDIKVLIDHGLVTINSDGLSLTDLGIKYGTLWYVLDMDHRFRRELVPAFIPDRMCHQKSEEEVRLAEKVKKLKEARNE